MSARLPVVLLPGFLGDAREMMPLAHRLGGRDVRCLDLPDGSPKVAGERLRQRVADDVGPDFHVACGSYGGLVSLGLGARSYAFVATVPGREHVPESVVALAAALRPLPASVVRRLYRARLARRLRADRVPDDLARALVAAAPEKDALLARLDGILRWDVASWPRAPVLWILGADDPEARWSADEVRSACPEAEVARVPGGHRPQASDPAVLVGPLERFWSTVEG